MDGFELPLRGRIHKNGWLIGCGGDEVAALRTTLGFWHECLEGYRCHGRTENEAGLREDQSLVYGFAPRCNMRRDEITYTRRKAQMEWKTKGWVNGLFNVTTNPRLVCTPLPQLSKLTWSPTSLLISNLIHRLHLNQLESKHFWHSPPNLHFLFMDLIFPLPLIFDYLLLPFEPKVLIYPTVSPWNFVFPVHLYPGLIYTNERVIC